MKNKSTFRFISLVILSWFLVQNIEAQVHHTKPGLDVPLLGVGTLGLAFSYSLQQDTKVLEENFVKCLEEKYAADRSIVFFLDRNTPTRSNTTAHSYSDMTLGASVFLPLSLFANDQSGSEAGNVGLMWAETVLLTGAITNLVKKSVRRPRPFVFNGAPLPSGYDKFKKDARFSFFSGHTSMSAASAFFTAQVYAHNNPNSGMRPVFWTTAGLLPALTGFLRQRAGKHYWTDVIVGYGVGALVGILVPKLHK